MTIISTFVDMSNSRSISTSKNSLSLNLFKFGFNATKHCKDKFIYSKDILGCFFLKENARELDKTGYKK